jgi:hypothetical protein
LARSITASISSRVAPAGKVEPGDAEAAEDAADQRLGRGVERARNGRSRRPAGRRSAAGWRWPTCRWRRSARPRHLPTGEAVLEDLLVGAVEARIDEALGAARALAGDAFEEALAGRAFSNTKVEVRKIGGLSEPSDSAGSKPWPIIRVRGGRNWPPSSTGMLCTVRLIALIRSRLAARAACLLSMRQRN